ncbi:hypothetical protein SAMN05518668_11650 [Sphingobium sp. YR657]|nr:hypothetical protein SAMN05518668_11650 [Sphingobium sp. YR657]
MDAFVVCHQIEAGWDGEFEIIELSLRFSIFNHSLFPR